jgi:hypothetical protein
MLTSRDFQRAAAQRYTTAEFLLANDFTLDALYLAGYSVECILKSLVMYLTPQADQQAAFQLLKSGAKMHYPEHLRAELRKRGRDIPLDLILRFRRFPWTTDLRYASGRSRKGEVRGYLKTAQRLIEWAMGEMK